MFIKVLDIWPQRFIPGGVCSEKHYTPQTRHGQCLSDTFWSPSAPYICFQNPKALQSALKRESSCHRCLHRPEGRCLIVPNRPRLLVYVCVQRHSTPHSYHFIDGLCLKGAKRKIADVHGDIHRRMLGPFGSPCTWRENALKPPYAYMICDARTLDTRTSHSYRFLGRVYVYV